MPHNNRVSGSIALRTNDMWSKTIGHNPYANQAEESAQGDGTSAINSSIAADHLMLLAKMSNLSGVESRGGCKKCGALGHMTFQCRNQPITAISKSKDDDTSSSSSDSDSDRDDRVDSKSKNASTVDRINPHDGSFVKRDDTSVVRDRDTNRDRDRNRDHSRTDSSDGVRVKRTRSKSESEDVHRHRHKKSKHSKKSKKHKHKDKHTPSKHKKHRSSD